MPSLRLFGQRTAVSGDDLWVFAGLAILLRIIQLGFLAPLLAFFVHMGDDGVCLTRKFRVADYGDEILYVYWALSLFLALCSIVVELLICRTTVKGTPVEPEKRSLLKPLCTIKIVPLSLLRIAVLVFGFMSVTTIEHYCLCEFDSTLPSGAVLKGSRNICPQFNSMAWLLRGLLVTQIIE